MDNQLVNELTNEEVLLTELLHTQRQILNVLEKMYGVTLRIDLSLATTKNNTPN